MTTYAGESVAKKIARARMYTAAMRAWALSGRPGGIAITLAGPEACEVGALRDFLAYKPADVLFVDRNAACIDAVKKRWPAARTFHGDLLDAIKATERIGFIHLDFMGNYTDSVDECFAALRTRLVPKGIATYTFLRGRESARLIRWREAAVAAEKIGWCLCDDASCRNETVRLEGYTELMRAAIEGRRCCCNKCTDQTEIFLVGLARYDSGRSPMGIISQQRMPQKLRGPRWERAYDKLCARISFRPRLISEDSDEDLRLYAVKMRKKGVHRDLVAALLDVAPATVTAWEAHATRGTYG